MVDVFLDRCQSSSNQALDLSALFIGNIEREPQIKWQSDKPRRWEILPE